MFTACSCARTETVAQASGAVSDSAAASQTTSAGYCLECPALALIKLLNPTRCLPAVVSNMRDGERAHPVHVDVEGLLRGEVVPLKQRPLLLEERVAGPDRRCQLKLVVGILFRDNACQSRFAS